MPDPFTYQVQPYDVPPHPRNLEFLHAHSIYVMKTLGESLHRICEANDVKWAPCFLRDYFVPISDEMKYSVPYRIQYGPSQPSRFDLAVNASSFAVLMRKLPMFLLEIECAVSRNLTWLQAALRLSRVETKLLLWTYVISHRGSENLRDAFSSVSFGAGSNASAAVAILLDEPVEVVAACYGVPNRLLAMRLTYRKSGKAPFGLDEFFQSGDLLPAVLETVHRSANAMLECLVEPDPNWTLEPAVETPSALYYEWFEQPVADAFAATVLGRPLNAEHIAALIEWLTGYQIESALCTLLAGHLTLEVIEQSIKCCFVNNARCDRLVTPLMVLSTLYAAAE